MSRDRGRKAKEGFQMPVKVFITRDAHEEMLASATESGKDAQYWAWFRSSAELIEEERF